jgi:hypothetical protein
MNTKFSSRLNTVTVLIALFLKPENEGYWKTVPALVRALNELQELADDIIAAGEAQQGRVGPAADRRRALQLLGDEAHAIASAVHAFAADTGDDSLALRTDLSRTAVTKGGNAAVVARCKAIHEAASDNADELKDYLVTTGDLTSLKKRIDGFDALKTKPREKIATSSAATKRLPKLFRQVNTLLTSRLDKLMVKLKAAQPNFYEEYRASRVVVNTAGRAAKKDEKADAAKKAA